MPRRGPELSPTLRARICELHSIGYGYKRIHKLHPEVPLSTIQYTVKKEAIRKDNHSRPRLGQPRKLSEEQRDQIFDTVRHINPDSTHHDLLASVDHVIKKRSLQMLLREMGLRKWRKLRRPQLSAQHAAQRLAWAETYQNTDWSKVKWSDECMVRRGHGQRPEWSFLRPAEQLEEGDVQTIRQRGVIKQMFWAGFGPERRTQLMALDGRVDGDAIAELYAATLPDFLQRGDTFMHDNAPVHTSRVVKAVLEALRITVMVWPPYSPDLNPIENLWALMKAEIYRAHPELLHLPDTVDSLPLLVAAAKEAWLEIDQAIHRKLCETMDHRVQAVLEAKGWYTKY